MSIIRSVYFLCLLSSAISHASATADTSYLCTGVTKKNDTLFMEVYISGSSAKINFDLNVQDIFDGYRIADTINGLDCAQSNQLELEEGVFLTQPTGQNIDICKVPERVSVQYDTDKSISLNCGSL